MLKNMGMNIKTKKKRGNKMEKEKRKAGPQPDGSWVLIDEDPPYKMPERQTDNPDEKEEVDVKEEE